MSYPISGIPASLPSGIAGAIVFDEEPARAINSARLNHLRSLGLSIEGRSVLDVGCGVGHLARQLADWGCRVVCADGRAENIAALRLRHPDLDAHVLNVETDFLGQLGSFEVVFCYGLLYHLENPLAGLRNMATVCDDLLLLETLVCDHASPAVALTDEPNVNWNQSLGSFGCRPSPAWVVMALNRAGFPYIYAPRTVPEHEDFHFEWLDNLDYARDGHPIRCIFIASRRPLDNSNLVPLLASQETSARTVPFSPAVSATWIDVGAHRGEKTFPVAQSNPAVRVYAFEPNLPVALEKTGVLPNFTVLPWAIGERDGTAEFYVNAYTGASSLLPFHAPGLDAWIDGHLLQVTNTVAVPVMRLDTFMRLMNIERVDYLKVDAQGADGAVIRSAGERLKDIAKISLEVQITPVPLYAQSTDKREIVEFLRSQGFRLSEVEKQSYEQEENLTFTRD